MQYKDFFDSLIICDSHLHLSDCAAYSLPLLDSEKYYCLSCAHSESEFIIQDDIIKEKTDFISAFGIHPQNPVIKNLDFLEKLIVEKKINCIGEAGFDFFTQELKENEELQKLAFESQLELAVKYSMPMIIHGRKCNDRFFFYAKQLSKLPAVMFHSYMGTFNEAQSLLNKGINCFFTFGKPLLNGNKKAIECTCKLDSRHLLLETDAPFQVLKGEEYTKPSDIFKVYEKAFEIRGIAFEDKEKAARFTEQLYSNFLQFQGKL
ncbi:MAG: TatD family hydrolase [Treponema sp.]|uniref:TatD family hydrolase n=1 Tax=Treponema sp. TaxID=166 RepID=UPI00298E5366|nr:TatD family hydrolase [Treponema sp.]MCQ2601916.1 TatD family hydrolase [Treponema sp.]